MRQRGPDRRHGIFFAVTVVPFALQTSFGQRLIASKPFQPAGQSHGLQHNEENVMQKISPCLWFREEAEEAVDFYVSIFPGAKKGRILRSDDVGVRSKGGVVMVDFELFGQSFQALNGNQDDPFTHAISMSVLCKDQAEVDFYWDRLIADRGKGVACSWLKDRYGVSWQIVPEILPTLLRDPDKAKAERVMAAMLKMVKIDVAAIEAAARG
jgi:predicted 3-demethylubiquinone-9 3-methyltransferase (glyoxalase superfamily)